MRCFDYDCNSNDLKFTEIQNRDGLRMGYLECLTCGLVTLQSFSSRQRITRGLVKHYGKIPVKFSVKSSKIMEK